MHTAFSNNTLFNYSDVTLNNVDSGSLLLATPHHDTAVSALEAAQNVGVYFSGDLGTPWSVYYENNSVPITPGRRFNATNIGFGAVRARLHASQRRRQYLGAQQLPNLASLVLCVSCNYNPGGVGGSYYDECVAFNFQSGHWYLENQNIADGFPIRTLFQ